MSSTKGISCEVVMLNRCIFFFTLPLWLTSTIEAEQTTGNLEGRILDLEVQPLAGVDVVLAGPSLRGTRTVWGTDRSVYRERF